VRINALREGTFFAEIAIDGPSGPAIVDARPSDAVSLALIVSAPIRVSRAIMDGDGMTHEQVEGLHNREPRPDWWPGGEPEPANRIVQLNREADRSGK
jgi:bifunctional DNase/RNase